MKIKLAKTELIHFVGIGGIGMSGLALIMKELGFKIQGSDISFNKNIERLKKNKIKVIIGHKKQNIKKSTILVISSAIKKNNLEYLEAKKNKLPIYKRGEMLAHIVSLLKRNIVVAGSHGKTTTTSLISAIFSKTKLDNNGKLTLTKESFSLPCDVVFKAIGQKFSSIPLGDNPTDKPALDKRGRITVNDSYQTTLTDVFAGGDCINGKDLVVEAVDHGNKAALAIHKQLSSSISPQQEQL